MSDRRRIAVLGGTFDPFHRGHLEPLVSSAEVMGWSEFLYVPAWQQPFKLDRMTTSPFHRYAMVVLGIAGEARARVTIDELERGGVSYSVDTVERIAADAPGTVIDWVIGDDNLELLPKWKSVGRILELANFVVLRRGPSRDLPAALAGRQAAPADQARAGGIICLDNSRIEVSSTEIRRRIRSGESITDLVGGPVDTYIMQHGLYQGLDQRKESVDG